MAGENILIVDNEPDLLDLVALHLEGAGMVVSRAASGSEAMTLLASRSFDLIILDIMMDDIDGFEVLQRMRSMSLEIPVILLSAKREDESKVHGFSIGADDYVTKPFSPMELVARVQAHIRRYRKIQPFPQSYKLTCGTMTLDPEAQVLYKHGRPILLSGTEAKILYCLMQRPNQVIAKMELFEQVWGHDHYDDNSLNVYMSRLRQKIEDDPHQPIYIQTVWGMGYRFMVDMMEGTAS